MKTLPADLLWIVVHHLPCDEILFARVVSRVWRDAIDARSRLEWRDLYCSRVCDLLDVGPHFDWRRAAARAARASTTIDAECTWKNVYVRVSAPWISDNMIDSPLRQGVVRREDVHTHFVDYVYDNTFRLRCLGRSCVQRQVTPQCNNCQNKRQCLFMSYTYYLRPLQDIGPDLDECLGLRLCDACSH